MQANRHLLASSVTMKQCKTLYQNISLWQVTKAEEPGASQVCPKQ